MGICLIGQNHKTAPVDLREQLALTDDKKNHLGELLARDDNFKESVLVSTCNRMELYAVCNGHPEPQKKLGSILEKVHGIDLNLWEETLYFRQERLAIQHLFRVASGLDSMVLGEGQILSQIKDAHQWATDNALAQDTLHRAFTDALSCGKRVRTDTKLSEGAVSVASAAVSLSRKIFNDLQEQAVLLIGAGDTGARTARHLQMFGVKDLRVTNRTRERAEKLGHELDAAVVPFQTFSSQISQVSIIVSAVSAPQPLLTPEIVRKALNSGGQRALFVIDLAVPRNVHPGVGEIPGVFLYNVDDLQGIVLEDEGHRRGEAEKAEGIVEEMVEKFLHWHRARAMAPTLSDLRRRAEALRQAELEGARAKMDEAAFKEMDKVTQRFMNKLLHSPTVHLKERANQSSSAEFLRDFRSLFALDKDKAP